MNPVLQVVLVFAGTFAVLAVALSYAKYERLVQTLRETRAAANLAPRDAFLVKVSERLSAAVRHPSPFCVLAAAPPGAGGGAPDAPDAPPPAWIAAMRTALRSTDEAWPLGDGRWGILLDAGFPRAAEILARACADPVAQAAALGVARWPEAAPTTELLLARAEEAWREAAARGPGARVVLPPPPAEAPAEERAIVAESRVLDPLTGILRPERMGNGVRKFVAQCRRDGRPVSVLYLDVDDLANVNERFGRDVGDAVLREVGRVLHVAIRETDLIGRLGEDDFLAVLECPAEGAAVAARRLLEQLGRVTVAAGLAKLRVTASVGIAGYPEHGTGASVLMTAAEAAYLEARRRGRHLCVVYEPGMAKAPRVRRAPEDVF